MFVFKGSGGSQSTLANARRLRLNVRREIKAAALGLGVAGLLALVTLAARGGHPSGNGRVTQRSVPHAVEDSLVTLVVIMYALVIIVGIILVLRFRGDWREPESHWLRNLVVIMSFLVILTVSYYAIARRPPTPPPDRTRIQNELRPQTVPPRGRVPIRQAKFRWPVVFAVLGLILVGGTVIAIYVRRRPPAFPESERTLEADLVQAVETTIDDLRRERDARRAVIAAYANMERVFASHGLARRRAEAPFEYLARILGGLDVRESAVHTLTQLFEYAKFSSHEIGTALKEDAIGALEDVRDDLRGREVLAA
jgi:multisubunit Na+/H+ antiporter MnhB subunit